MSGERRTGGVKEIEAGSFLTVDYEMQIKYDPGKGIFYEYGKKIHRRPLGTQRRLILCEFLTNPDTAIYIGSLVQLGGRIALGSIEPGQTMENSDYERVWALIKNLKVDLFHISRGLDKHIINLFRERITPPGYYMWKSII